MNRSKEDEFLAKLSELMREFECQRIIVRDDYVGYPECGQELNLVFEFDWAAEAKDFKVDGGFYLEQENNRVRDL